jgi:hypothetical protein
VTRVEPYAVWLYLIEDIPAVQGHSQLYRGKEFFPRKTVFSGFFVLGEVI